MDVAAGVIRGVERELTRLQEGLDQARATIHNKDMMLNVYRMTHEQEQAEISELRHTIRYTVNALIFLQDEADRRGQSQLGTAIYGLRQKIVEAMSPPLKSAAADDTEAR